MTVTVHLDEQAALALCEHAGRVLATRSWRKYHPVMVPLHEALTNALEWEKVQAHEYGPLVDIDFRGNDGFTC